MKSNEKCALKWWNKMNLEEQFYITIEHNDLIQGDCTRHPHTLTSTEIEIIWGSINVDELSINKR